MAKKATTALKGHVEMLLLAVLDSGPLHGYAVIEDLRSRSGEDFDLPEGTVYPVLHRLESDGFLSSDWSTVGGRRRRTYSLTRDGRRELARQRKDWGRFRSAMDKVIGAEPWPEATR